MASRKRAGKKRQAVRTSQVPGTVGVARMSGVMQLGSPTSTAAGDGGGAASAFSNSSFLYLVRQYQRYRFTKAVVEYVPIQGANTNGSLCVAFLVDPEDVTSFTAIAAQYQWSTLLNCGGIASPVSKSWKMALPSNLRTGEWKYTAQGLGASDVEKRQEIPFFVTWGMTGCSALSAAQGLLRLHYEIECVGPVSSSTNP